MPIKEWTQQCKSCDGTGVYVGIGERDGAAVVCYQCEGTGQVVVRFEYSDYSGRKERADVTQVYEVNPGIVAAPKVVPGGIAYEDWLKGGPKAFPPKTEMREHACPAWWYQRADSHPKPQWEECGYGVFAKCAMFALKRFCWVRWDHENGLLDGATGEAA